MIYGDFAKIYDALMYDFDYDLVYETLKNTVDKNTLNILELACGTGSLTEKLANNYNVDALDLSEDMLSIAQNKINKFKNVKLFKQDMRYFNMSKTYDACFCICDSLNYILKKDDIDNIFKNVYNHLEENGKFIFDLNTERKFLDMEEVYVEEVDDVFYVWENYYDYENKLNTYGVNFFVEKDEFEDIYKRVYEEHIERAYSIDFVKESLKKAGFQDVEIYDDYYLDEVSDFTHRLVFIARR
ncbi:class I SAM-dependent DNA methyltransferase [Peptoniphilus stercorisuis]|uniref:Ubiquinone/menaquinone biosynthesis C-methylase UbiE n=1 Tax=Peptoniphilus stercorisuis TaxID=1436965 RepID=A0ABS4KCH5_9FIRM|nr:class I SAM-dependent methyltransferase [Peptoniphilus stercorisuis]MBP2025473.1 ubiquinone/menaquinone biosynthesis C-methylase UbiE [Peptoniphilus stercorisuis]